MVIVFLVGVLDMSGWMFMGLFGVMYVLGLFVGWIVVGLIFGVLVNYMLVVLCFCVYIEVVNNFIIFFDYFENCFVDNMCLLCVIVFVVIVVFFMFYIFFGVVVGGKFFEILFGLIYEIGLYVIVGVVVVYIFVGGFMVVSMIDFV